MARLVGVATVALRIVLANQEDLEELEEMARWLHRAGYEGKAKQLAALIGRLQSEHIGQRKPAPHGNPEKPQ
jgi:hypothetical protein